MSEKQRRAAAEYKEQLERLLLDIELDDLHLQVDSDGQLYLCADDPSCETPGAVLDRIEHSMIPWDPEQFKGG